MPQIKRFQPQGLTQTRGIQDQLGAVCSNPQELLCWQLPLNSFFFFFSWFSPQSHLPAGRISRCTCGCQEQHIWLPLAGSV